MTMVRVQCASSRGGPCRARNPAGDPPTAVWEAEHMRAFDKNNAVGLHHLALRVESIELLNSLYRELVAAGVLFEFAPEPLREGPATHMMCYEPGGNRIEFIFPG